MDTDYSLNTCLERFIGEFISYRDTDSFVAAGFFIGKERQIDSCLLIASKEGYMDIVIATVRNGRGYINSALINASEGGHLDIIKYLYNQGGGTSCKALIKSLPLRKEDIVFFFLDRGIKIDWKTIPEGDVDFLTKTLLEWYKIRNIKYNP